MSRNHIVRLPRAFFDDREERELPVPSVVRESVRYVWVSRNSAAYDALIEDARYYAGPDGPDMCPEITTAAKRLLAADAKQLTPLSRQEV